MLFMRDVTKIQGHGRLLSFFFWKRYNGNSKKIKKYAIMLMSDNTDFKAKVIILG